MPHILTHHLALLAVLVLLATLAAPGHAATYQKVALTGEALAGVPELSPYNLTPRSMALSNTGHIIFGGTTQDTVTGSWNAPRVFAGTPGNLSALASPSPEHDVPIHYSYGHWDERIYVGEDGRYALWDAGWQPQPHHIWSHHDGVTTLVSSAPSIDAVAFNGTGSVFFVDSEKFALWDGASTQTIIEIGDAAPQMGPDTFISSSNGGLLLSDTNRLVLSARYTSPTGSGGALWTGTADDLSLLAYVGQQAPGTPEGTLFDHISISKARAVNDAGRTLFVTYASDGSPGSTPPGIWSDAGGSLALVARNGDPAPGINGVFAAIDYAPRLNDANQIAFTARVAGQDITTVNDAGIWRVTDGVAELVFREGAPVAGLDAAPVLEDTYPYPLERLISIPMLLGNKGEIVFTANDTTARHGLWFIDADGNLRRLLRQGDLFNVSSDPLAQDLRIIEKMSLSTEFFIRDERDITMPVPLADPQDRINDLGQFLILLTFTDGSEGLFLATIPEPTTALALLALATPLLRRRR